MVFKRVVAVFAAIISLFVWAVAAFYLAAPSVANSYPFGPMWCLLILFVIPSAIVWRSLRGKRVQRKATFAAMTISVVVCVVAINATAPSNSAMKRELIAIGQVLPREYSSEKSSSGEDRRLFAYNCDFGYCASYGTRFASPAERDSNIVLQDVARALRTSGWSVKETDSGITAHKGKMRAAALASSHRRVDSKPGSLEVPLVGGWFRRSGDNLILLAD